MIPAEKRADVARALQEASEVFDLHRRATSVCSENDSEIVSRRKDLKPENILFNGDRVGPVDWEAVFVNELYWTWP